MKLTKSAYLPQYTKDDLKHRSRLTLHGMRDKACDAISNLHSLLAEQVKRIERHVDDVQT